MRMQFFAADTRRQVALAAPWAAVIAKCDGGYMAFGTRDDYRRWRRQK